VIANSCGCIATTDGPIPTATDEKVKQNFKVSSRLYFYPYKITSKALKNGIAMFF
jgi:hypothetical protein